MVKVHILRFVFDIGILLVHSIQLHHSNAYVKMKIHVDILISNICMYMHVRDKGV